MKTVYVSLLLAVSSVYTLYAQTEKQALLTIQEQGSFAIGGTVTTDKDGNKFHGDHAYVFYQKPVHPHKYPIVFLHGIHQASKTWETTPDGREGFQNIFLRKAIRPTI